MILLLITLVFFIVKPFLAAILASFVFAYVFYPVYLWIKKYLKNETFSSIVVTVLVLLIFFIPILFVATSISSEATQNYILIKQVLATGEIVDGKCVNDTIVCNTVAKIQSYIKDPQINFQLTNFLSNSTQFLVEAGTNFVLAIPLFLVSFFIMLFIIFYLLKEGHFIAMRLQALIPLSISHSKRIFKQLNEVTYAVVYGHLLTAGIQGALGGIAFLIFGVTSPILWAFMMFFFALVPFLGTPVIWVPAVLIKAATNHPVQAIGLLIAGLFISIIDNFIRPKLVSGKATVHPVLVLLGVIGGLAFFGPIGIIVGPVILSIFVKFIEIYEEEKRVSES